MNIIPVPIIMNTTRTVDCITSSGKTYCEKSDIPRDIFGIGIIASVIWVSILIYFIWKFVNGDWSALIPASYAFISFILLGLYFIII